MDAMNFLRRVFKTVAAIAEGSGTVQSLASKLCLQLKAQPFKQLQDRRCACTPLLVDTAC